ncbi:condensin-2 complex subunit D3 [Oryzias melastigma]|uniref:condensin-2 complex subunit D3 n=1 Tax=Oryzias melastigma TaxID=30732 RepID=UPI00168D0723|nr:condensin-2 complex subunit D3 [Oryzias melastigma]
MDVIGALQFLKLNKIPEAWVNLAWDTEFTERSPLDDVLEKEVDESEDEAFRTLYHCFLTYVPDQQHSTSINGSSQSIWGILRENGVSIKALVAVLSFYVLGAKTKAANTQHRVRGLYAASLYLLLLKIPGSIANQVFHEVLLDTCSDLTPHCWPQDSAKKRKKDRMKSSQAEGKRAKPQRKKPPQMDMDEAEEEEDEEEDIYFSNEDLMKIREAAVFLVHSILRLLQTFPLKDRPETASNFTQIFCQLLHFEPVLGEITFAAPRDVAEMRSIPEMAFYGLELLCSAKHGDQKESLRRVFHQLLYVILMMNKESRGKPVLRVLSQSVLAIRDYAIQFVCHLVEEQREQAKPFLDILLQHICFQIVEKSEYRSHGAQAVGMLTSQMENADYSRFIRWLFNFSRQPKVSVKSWLI